MLPPFCPNPKCICHSPDTASKSARRFYRYAGFHLTDVVGPVQRFRCVKCGKYFSERTFSLDYWTRKSLNNMEIFRAISSGESLASIGRNLDCSSESVQNRLDRLGRNSLALHSRMTRDFKLREDLAADGFESFERSHFFPSYLNILVGVESQLLYRFSFTSFRRKGRMTEAQKRRRAVYDAVHPLPRGAVKKAFTRLAAQIPALWDPSIKPTLILRSDEHPAYPVSIQSVKFLAEKIEHGVFLHECHSSTAPRTITNPLFPVNYYDRELRKDIAAYRRESTCITRNVGNGLLRFANHLAWHNYRKQFRAEVRGFEGNNARRMGGNRS